MLRENKNTGENRELETQRETIKRIRVGFIIASVLALIGFGFGWYRIEKGNIAKLHKVVAQQQRDKARIEAALQKKYARALETTLKTGALAANKFVFDLAAEFKHSVVPTPAIVSMLEKARKFQHQLVSKFPEDMGLQSNSAAALIELGDIYLRLNSLEEAAVAYNRSLVIVRELASRDVDSTRWQHDISTSLNKVGDLRLHSGDAAAAIMAYEESLVIRSKLAALDVNNIQWQRDISINLDKIGDLKLHSDDVMAALTAYEESLTIRRKLIATDGQNTKWQRAVSISLVKIGDVKLHSGDDTNALSAYNEGLEIHRKLLALDAKNTQWLRDISVNLERIGDVSLRFGKAITAFSAYEEGLLIRRKLAAYDANNAQWQRDITISLIKLGNLHEKSQAYRKSYFYYKLLVNHTSNLVMRFPQFVEFSDHAKFARSKLANAAGNAAYFALFDRRFKEAEAKSRVAIELDPDALWLKTNLAHALLLQGKLAAADEIYFKFSRKKINKQLWDKVILDDFRELKSKNISHPHMVEIKRLFEN